MPDNRFRIFISSPGDVGQERVIAERVIERLRGEFGGRADLEPVLSPSDVVELVAATRRLHVSEPVLDYVQSLVEATREHAALQAGLSPRAALALLRTARAHALLQGQEFVLPDNVKQVFPALATHRLQCVPNAGDPSDVVAQLLADTRVP